VEEHAREQPVVLAVGDSDRLEEPQLASEGLPPDGSPHRAPLGQRRGAAEQATEAATDDAAATGRDHRDDHHDHVDHDETLGDVAQGAARRAAEDRATLAYRPASFGDALRALETD